LSVFLLKCKTVAVSFPVTFILLTGSGSYILTKPLHFTYLPGSTTWASHKIFSQTKELVSFAFQLLLFRVMIWLAKSNIFFIFIKSLIRFTN